MDESNVEDTIGAVSVGAVVASCTSVDWLLVNEHPVKNSKGNANKINFFMNMCLKSKNIDFKLNAMTYNVCHSHDVF